MHHFRKLRYAPLRGLFLLGLVLGHLCGLGDPVAAQQNPDGRFPLTAVAEPFLFLIRDPVVHEELGLSARQREAVEALNDQLDPGLWSMRNKSAEQIAQTNRRAVATARKRLASLLTPIQTARLEEIRWWTLGTRAFLRDDFADRLGLSDEQRDAIRQTLRETQDAVGALSRRTDRPRAELEEQTRSLQTDAPRQILAALTDAQREGWRALLGKRIDVSRLGRIRFKAPELEDADEWINSPPLTLQQLKGKVIALHFYAFA